jgi:hypothetical protein
LSLVAVTAAGVDTWSPCWYVDTDGRGASWLREFATVHGPRGSQLLPEPIAEHRVGWFPSGLLFAEGHPGGDGSLCPASELLVRALDLQEALQAADVPVNGRQRSFASLGSMSEGWAGVRRVDATVNVDAVCRGDGLAVLAGVAACVRDAPGHAEVRYGVDHAVETVYLRGYAGKRVLGRCYDKGLESNLADRGRLLRFESQQRWGKLNRRDVDELDAAALRSAFHRRFYPLYQATKGVTVGGPTVVASKLLEAVAAGEITAQSAESLCGHLMFRAVGGRRGAGISRRTMYRREQRARELGVVLGDGVLEEVVEVDVGAVLEQCLDTELWDRRG